MAQVPSQQNMVDDGPLLELAPADISTSTTRVIDSFGHVFVENQGQVQNTEILFYMASGEMAFTSDSVFIYSFGQSSECASSGRAVKLSFVNANSVTPVGRNPTPWNSSYFIGDDPTMWRTGMLNYLGLVYENLWDGIDLHYYLCNDKVKYDFVVHPGADYSNILVCAEGQDNLQVSENGSLVIDLGDNGMVIDSELDVHYSDDAKHTLDACFNMVAEDTYSFHIPNVDSSRTLVIDPLIYSGLIGGAGQDRGLSVAVGPEGHAYVTGETFSIDLPSTAGAFDLTQNGVNDVFVMKLGVSGDFVEYFTVLGGAGYDVGHDIVVDQDGCAYVTGETYSIGFPVGPVAIYKEYNGVGDAFVVKLGPSGDSLVYSTFLGGSHDEAGLGIALDASGNTYITGYTWSGDFPTTGGGYSRAHSGDADIFVTKLNTMGDILIYSTFIGGIGSDLARCIAVDGDGFAYIAGITGSADMPVTSGAINTTSESDAFVMKLSKNGGSLVYSFRISGIGRDDAWDIAIDQTGCAYITGETSSVDFPVTDPAFDSRFNGDMDAFVTKLDASGEYLIYSTYLGGSNADHGRGIAVDMDGSAHVVGYTDSTNLPTTINALFSKSAGGIEAFLAKFDGSGHSPMYLTYLGGADDDMGLGIALDQGGCAYITGETASEDFPAVPAQTGFLFKGDEDAFVAKFDITIPTADAGRDMILNETTNAQFDGTACKDNVGITNYTWTFNDGSANVTLYGPSSSHPFDIPGFYRVQLNVTDSVGNWNMDMMNVTVLMQPIPTADAGSDQTVKENQKMMFNGTSSRDNVGIVSFTWSFDDGINAVTLPGPSPAWTFMVPGTYVVSLNVSDAEANWAVDVANVTILDVTPPVAIVESNISVISGSRVMLNGSHSTDAVGIVNYSWSVYHNDTITELYGVEPSFEFWEAGNHLVTLTVRDAAGNEASNVILVTTTVPEDNDTDTTIYLGSFILLIAVIVALAILLIKRPEKRTDEEDMHKSDGRSDDGHE